MAYQTRIGHVHLKVRDLVQALAFYQKYLHLKIVETVGNQYAFLSGGDFHHELALQQVRFSWIPVSLRTVVLDPNALTQLGGYRGPK